jgi:phosphoglycolate phosphatase-like HAD superfamily hydrolase
MRVLALDFDGVLCDSAREAYRVAVETFASELPEHALPAGAAGDAALYARFVEAMPLGNRAEDYAVVLAALARGVALPDQAAYDAFRATLPPERLRAFHRRFYRVRAAWAERDPGGWLAEMRPYPGLDALLRRRAGEARLAIATAKDRASVRRLLESYGLGDLFADGFVLDKEAGEKKRDHVRELAARAGCRPAEVTFVDDKVNHLEDVAKLGARCVLATWGYNGPREQRIAEARGFLVCGLADFERRVFGPAARASDRTEAGDRSD